MEGKRDELKQRQGRLDLEQFTMRARERVEKHGGLDESAFGKLCSLVRYVDGDYKDPATFAQLRKELGLFPIDTRSAAVHPTRKRGNGYVSRETVAASIARLRVG